MPRATMLLLVLLAATAPGAAAAYASAAASAAVEISAQGRPHVQLKGDDQGAETNVKEDDQALGASDADDSTTEDDNAPDGSGSALLMRPGSTTELLTGEESTTGEDEESPAADPGNLGLLRKDSTTGGSEDEGLLREDSTTGGSEDESLLREDSTTEGSTDESTTEGAASEEFLQAEPDTDPEGPDTPGTDPEGPDPEGPGAAASSPRDKPDKLSMIISATQRVKNIESFLAKMIKQVEVMQKEDTNMEKDVAGGANKKFMEDGVSTVPNQGRLSLTVKQLKKEDQVMQQLVKELVPDPLDGTRGVL